MKVLDYFKDKRLTRHQKVDWYALDEQTECCHDLNIEGNTLTVVPKRTMVQPDSRQCFCTNCKRIFNFVKNEEGIWVERPKAPKED